MSKNLIAATANDLYDQIQKVKTAKGADLDREVTRMGSMSTGATGIALMADKQIQILRETGFLPDDNVLIDRDETKLVNAKRNLAAPKPKSSRMSLDEFIRG